MLKTPILGRTSKHRLASGTALMLMALQLSACGQKGPLYLAPAEQAAPQKPGTTQPAATPNSKR
jgi:predicted small lipoprotein YifL